MINPHQCIVANQDKDCFWVEMLKSLPKCIDWEDIRAGNQRNHVFSRIIVNIIQRSDNFKKFAIFYFFSERVKIKMVDGRTWSY